MTNINVQIQGTANLGQMSKEFAALQAQVAGLNAQLAKTMDMSKASGGVDPRGYERLSKAAALNSSEFRKAAASTGMFEVQQVRLNSATDEYVKKLNAQKMSFRELMRTRKIASAAYREQLAMESMLVKKAPSGTTTNKEVFDVVTPKRYDDALNTAGRRLSWFNERLKSGANQMVNWGKNTQWAGRQLMVGFTIPLVAFGAAAGVMAYRLDAEFTRVRKVYDTTADSASGSMKDMMAVQNELAAVTKAGTQTAISAAKLYGQAATDTIAVQAELAATGKTGIELQKNTLEVMRIARLGEIDNQVATEATIALQSIFRMSNQDLAESFNYMNAVENATSLSTADFAQAIPVAASAVKAWGGDIKELGILLTAMKENGIAAGEGANAIKATMQRLARPSKQVREEFEGLTGVDIMDITENATGLVDVFTQINDVTKDLSDSDRRKAFAGLFGSYQVSRMMALTKGMGELQAGIGQVSDAYRIAGKAPEEWRQIAENEAKLYRESISGQFKTTLENLKIQLAEMGGPFVQAATIALKAIAGIIEGFNNAPSMVKWGIAVAAVIAGIAGPLVMLTGLFANLFGNALKMTGGMLNQFNKLLGVMGILPREARINALAAELMEQGYQSQTKAVKGLTMELEKLIIAQQAANKASAGMLANTVNITKSKALIAKEEREAAHARLTGHMNTTYGQVGVDNKIRYFEDPKNAKVRLTNAEAYRRAQADIAAEDKKIAATTAKTAQNVAKTRRHLTGAAVAGGAFAAGMVLSMATSNETANEIGNMLILGSLVVPAAIELSIALAASVKYLKAALILEKAGLAVTKVKVLLQTAFYRTSLGATKAMLAYNAAAASGASIMGRLTAGATVLASGWTLAIAAVAAVGVGIWAWKKHLDKIREEQAKFHMDLNSMTDTWADKLGVVKKEYQGIAEVQEGISKQERYNQMVDAYSSDEFKDQRTAFADAGPDLRMLSAIDHFASLQADYGLSAADAAENIKALYEAAGLGATEADAAVKKLMEDIGGVSMGSGEQLQIQVAVYFDKEQGTKEAKDAAKDVGEAFAQEWASASSGEESAALLQRLNKILRPAWESAWADLATASQTPLTEALVAMGISTGEQLREAMAKAGGAGGLIDALFPDARTEDKTAMMIQLQNAAGVAAATEKELVGSIAASVPGIDNATSSIWDLVNGFDNLAFAGQQLSADEFKNYLDILRQPNLPSSVLSGMIPGMDQMEASLYSITDETDKWTAANKILASQGYQQITTEAEWIDFLAGNLPNKIDQATAAARGLAAGMGAVRASLGQIGREAMEATQQSFADAYSGYKNDQYDAELQAENDRWDQRIENAGNAGEAARAALDKAWERKNDAAEKYWDHRVELVDKAIEAEEKAEEKREKMFDAEIARIQKLNDMANANIDFNVALNEGKLDEAAKLRNDMEAGTSVEAIERARDKLATQSDKRVDRLGKKKDRIEKQRDAAMKAMQKEEEAQKAHLDKMTQANQAALEQQRDDAVAATEARIEARKKVDEQEIAMLMAGTATSKKELLKRIKAAGLDYKDFYRDVIKPQGLKWGDYFGTTLEQELKKSADAIRTDAMWEQLGSDSLSLMARGMGFSGKMGLMHFLKTGEVKQFSENKPAKPNTSAQDKNQTMLGGNATHGGGWAGESAPNRVGVAKNYKGLHPSETMLLAQKGEFVVNKKAAAKHGALLEGINSDEYNAIDRIKNGRGGLGAGMGPSPFFAAAFTRAMATKTNAALGTAVTNKQTELANMATPGFVGAFGTLGSGTYGNTSFGDQQVANARLIASIGKNMGMSSRDIEIAIMTAITESSLINNPGGDRDSVGLFQQRPSQGWGSYAQVSNPTYAATKFYSVLRGVTDRASMAPWMAAQAVQRSAFSDGSNYQAYWDEATDMFNSMQATPASLGGGGGAYYGPGPGAAGLSRASIPGKGWSNTHDYHNGLRSPIFAAADGYVTSRVYGVNEGSGQGSGAYPLGYGSYGVTANLRADNGLNVLAAHLWPGSVVTGRVRSGQQIALSASTGNSTGPHTHFEVNGSENASGLFASMGIGLRKGAEMVRFDNTLANLHRGESVMTKDISNDLRRGAQQFANGRGMGDTINVYPSEGMNEEALANKVVRKIDKKQRRRPVTRTVGSR